jgi:hypothetical protein
LLQELAARQMVIPPNPLGLAIRPQAIQCARGGSRSQRRSASRRTNVREEPADAAQLDLQHKAYVAELRSLLVERLQLEDEFERLQMYSRDARFDLVDIPTKCDLGRVILDMLHCPMRMNEKVLFMLYFAAMNRFRGDKKGWQPVLESMTNIVRRIGDLPPSWSHTTTSKKSKAGAILNDKLDVFHMDYEASKQIFNYNSLGALYEVIDIALPPITGEENAANAGLGVNVEDKNANWRYFMISYLNCLEYLTLHRDYRPGEVDELERRCKKMYTSLVTQIGGIEGVTNYFHYVGSGHVVWMCRKWGNLWRYRNEGVEAFNKIVSVRHNQHNGNGGRKRTRAGEPVQTCPEFWSVGQWLGRWSIWQLGYGDDMDPDRMGSSRYTTPNGECGLFEASGESDSDEAYTTDSSSAADDGDEVYSDSDDDRSVASMEILPCTPYNMPMMECRERNLLHRHCVDLTE